MGKQNELIARINEKYPKMSKSHKAISAFIAEHYEHAVFMTAAEIGREVGISESTVVRFASGLGYEGFPEFQKALEDWIKNKLSLVQKVDAKYGGSSQSEILQSIVRADMENLEETLESIDPVAFETAIDTILKGREVYIVGMRSCAPLAEFLGFYLNMIRGNIHVITTTNMAETFEQMIRINGEDVVIGISFPRYSMRTLKMMEFANDRNTKVITLTDSVHSPMNLYSSCNLLAKSDMMSIVDSLTAPLSVINALVVALCSRCSDQVKKTLEDIEQAWDSYQIYSRDEIDKIEEEF